MNVAKRWSAIVLVLAMFASLTLPFSVNASTANEPWMTFAGQGSLEAQLIARYSSGAEFDEGGAEIVAYDSVRQQLYSVNGAEKSLDIISMSSLSTSEDQTIQSLDLTKRLSLEQISTETLPLNDITSVAIHPSDDYIAVAATADPKTDPGYIIFVQHDGTYLNHLQVGSLPDMVTFTPDGNHALVANEGEPNDAYTVDPVGSVSIIDVTQGAEHVSEDDITTAGFEDLDHEGIRIVKPGASFAEDAEPEYIVVSEDSRKAYVVLQENNAIAVLDIAEKRFDSVHSLGVIDHSMPGFALDASDKDGAASLKNWPTLGMFNPDGMSIYTANDQTYILTANEGDAKDYDGFSEEARVEDLADRLALDDSHYAGFTQEELDAMMETLTDEEQLGRLKTTTSVPLNEAGNQEAIYSYGTRSFSVWDAETMELVFDSGDQFERITKVANPEAFNTNNDENSFDTRSDDKGTEPEAVIAGRVGDRDYAFVGLERAGGIMAYDLSDPSEPVFDIYFSSRSYDLNEETPSGDVAPEGLTFVEAAQSPTGEALLIVANELSGTVAVYALKPSTQTRIQIIATNDLHSRVYEDSGMGYAKIASVIEHYRKMNPNTLVLDAGDTVHGQTFSTLVEGMSIIEILNKINYDAMTPGNHDFNYGYEHLLELGNEAVFPILAANIKKDDGSYAYDPYVIKEVADVKIGIFGLATPETIYKTHPDNVAGITFTPPAEAAREMVELLEDQVDIVINLAHLGTDGSTSEANRSDYVTSEVAGIDLTIDGHSHELVKKMVDDTLLVQFGEYGEQVGIITLVMDEGEIVSKDSHYVSADDAKTMPANQEIENLIQSITEEQNQLLDQVIGNTAVHLSGEREVVRTGESNLGNLITDAMVADSGADIALTNGGGIRASIEEGDITVGDVITALPFGNFIVTIEVTGQELKDALEVGATGYPAAHGAFSHVSGMTYKIDPDAEVGDRIHHVLINGEALDLQAAYTLATNDFLAAGGDQYTMFADNTIINNASSLDEAVIVFVEEQGIPSSQVESRIVVETKARSGIQPETQPETQPDVPAETPVEGPDEAPGETDSGTEPVAEKDPGQDAAEPVVYTVQSGDTLTKIARMYNTVWQTLQQTNQIQNPHLIFPGQEIIIP